MVLTVTSTPFCSAIHLSARRLMLALKPPARPRSLVTTTSSTFFTSRRDSSGWLSEPGSERLISVDITASSVCAYGRAAMTPSWARRSFAAETIFIALVIWRVFLTERIRFRMSRNEAMARAP
jgi:hypothetical protein